MKKLKSFLWGAVIIALGVLVCLNNFGKLEFDLFFEGFWTLFIIVPCLIGLICERDKFGCLIGILIGGFLLLCEQEILSLKNIWNFALPVGIVLIGVYIIYKGVFNKTIIQKSNGFQESDHKTPPSSYTSIFSGGDHDFSGKVFNGAEFDAVFGGIEAHLQNSIIQNDVYIRAGAIFGGIDLHLPPNVNVKVQSTAIFGGVENRRRSEHRPEFPTVYISANCVFGGIDID